MLFRKNIEPSCAYCAFSSPVDDESLICRKKGMVKPWGKCRRFVYEPLKREPEAPAAVSSAGLSEEDFKL